MSAHLEPGDLAVFIKSLDGLNVGKVVQCVRVAGIHPDYGLYWLVRSRDNDLISEYGGIGDTVHAPHDWLRKITPPPLTLPNETKTIDKVE